MKKIWNALTVEQRTALIEKDPSMKSPTWKKLKEVWANRTWDELTPLQKLGTEERINSYH